jgi:hypothetical protein
MPAVFHVTGPVWHYVVFPYTPTVAEFLGTSEVAPRVRIKRAYKPVMNDIGGQLMPLERIYQGQECQIVTALDRYDEAVYAKIAAAPRSNLGPVAVPRGTNGFYDTGALVQQNSGYFTLILQFPFASTINQPVGNGMPLVYNFPICVPEQDDFNSLGTAERQTYLAITACRKYDTTVVPPRMITYTNTAGVALPNPS